MATRLIAILAFLCFASAAQAQIVWSAAGTTCVPTGATVGHYQTAATVSAVRHLGTETGTLVFTCGMDRFNNGTTNWNVQLAYRDSTGTGASASVVARLYRMPVGGFTPTLMATASSNSSATTTNTTINSADFNHTFDFDTYIYFVQVTLVRGSSTETIQFHSVLIQGADV